MENDTIAMLAKGRKEYALAILPENQAGELALRDKYANLPAVDTWEGYEAHRVALGELVKARTTIEKRRKELKADSLAYGRRVDDFAKYYTAFIDGIEAPIRERKQLVDGKAERERKAKEEAERLKQEEEARQRIAAEEAVKQAARDAEEARLKAIRDAEAERNRIENNRLVAEREKFLKEQKEAADKQMAADEAMRAERKAAEDAARIDREKIGAERAEVERKQKLVAEEQEKIARAQEAERIRLEREEFQKQAKAKAEQAAREQIERERIEAEQRAKAKAEAERKENARLDAMRPDVETLRAFAANLRATQVPAVKSAEARGVLDSAMKQLANIAFELESFKVPAQKKKEKVNA